MKWITKTANGGWRAFRRVNGRLHSKRFKPGTTLERVKFWCEEIRVDVRRGVSAARPGHTFADDVDAYLDQIRTMPTFTWRKTDIHRWLHVLGSDIARSQITTGQVRAHLEMWKASGYSASTVNHRRTALMHFFTVMDGKSARNPARDTPRYETHIGPPRDLTLPALDAILDHMPTSQTRARLVLFRWTGWPPAQMAKMQSADIRWDEAVFVRARRKGKGVAGTWLPLLPQAWDALREFKRLGCWGTTAKDGTVTYWSTSSARKSFRLAARKARRAIAAARARGDVDRVAARALWVELRDVTPYQIRHTFGTLVARTTQDDRAAQTLMQHADIRTTHRYTGGTVDQRTLLALQKVAKSLQAVTGEDSS